VKIRLVRVENRVSAITNKQGQAFIETMFFLPFFVMFLFFIYQSYASIHKAQIAQKYLKAVVIENALNRFDVTHSEHVEPKGPFKGKFAFVYSDIDGQVSYAITGTSLDMLTIFARADQGSIKQSLSDLKSKSTLGMCMGDGTALGQTTSPNVLGGIDTCTQ